MNRTRQVVTQVIVTCCGNKNALVVSIHQCIFNRNGDCGSTKRHVDDGCTVHVGITNCLCNIGVVEVTRGCTSFKHHNFAVEGNTDCTNFVVFRSDNTSNVSAVAVVVHWIVVVTNAVPTTNVVNVAVIVIVDAVIWDFRRVIPNVIAKVFVVVVYTSIDNSYNNVRTTTRCVVIATAIEPSFVHTKSFEVLWIWCITIARDVDRLHFAIGFHDVVVVDLFEDA